MEEEEEVAEEVAEEVEEEVERITERYTETFNIFDDNFFVFLFVTFSHHGSLSVFSLSVFSLCSLARFT